MEKRADGLAQFVAPSQAAAPSDETEQKADRADKSSKSRRSVYIYIATLFLVVLLFTTLSYFIQQRNSSEIDSLHEKNATAQQNIENLQTVNLQLKEESKSDRALISELRAQLEELEKQITEIRQQWQEEVQSIKQNEQEAYDALLEKYNALMETFTETANQNGAEVIDA